jgi:hypothetical protein
MRVRVEEAALQHLLQGAADADVDEGEVGRTVERGGRARAAFSHPDHIARRPQAHAVHPVHDEHAPGAQGRDHGGDVDAVEGTVERAKPFSVRALDPIIQLPKQGPRPLVHERGQIRVDPAHGPRGAGGGAQEKRVARERGRDAGALHLDRDFNSLPATVFRAQSAPVNLAQRRGRDGGRREGRKHDVRRLDPQLDRDDRARLVVVKRGHLVLQRLQRAHKRGGEEVGAGAQRLPDFGERRAQALQGAGEGRGAVVVAALAAQLPLGK